MSRAFLGILTRVLLVIFTFVLIVALAQLALVSASTRAEHLSLGEVVRRAWDGTSGEVVVQALLEMGASA